MYITCFACDQCNWSCVNTVKQPRRDPVRKPDSYCQYGRGLPIWKHIPLE